MNKFLKFFYAMLIGVMAVGLTACGDDDEGDDHNGGNTGGQDRIINVRGVNIKMIYVEGGTFRMGATPEQTQSGCKILDDEYPVHNVTLSSFYIAEFQITEGLWDAVMKDKEYTGYGSEDKPTNGSWQDFDE